MKRALDNFKAVLDLKVNQESSATRSLSRSSALSTAALEISQLD
jgi:hypothetical protein